jgi:predicted Zn finger-like uncharacterized protein
MIFACPNCQTQYNIAPEKFAGRVLRLRCRYCEHQIVVRDATGRHRQPTDVLRVAAALMDGEAPTGHYAGPPPADPPRRADGAAPAPPRPLPPESTLERARVRSSEGAVVETSPNAARRIRVPTGLFAKIEGTPHVEGPPPGDRRSGVQRRHVTSPGLRSAQPPQSSIPGSRGPAGRGQAEPTRRDAIPEDLYAGETVYESVPASMLEDLGPVDAIDFVDVDPIDMMAAIGAPPPSYLAEPSGPPAPTARPRAPAPRQPAAWPEPRPCQAPDAPAPPPKSVLQSLNHPALWVAIGVLAGVIVMALLK